MGAAARGSMGIVSLILIAVSILFMFFVILSGVSHRTPFDKTYFLKADTSKIPGARSISQWTYFYVCGEGNNNCGSPVPALPVGYAWLGGSAEAPHGLVGSHGKHTTSFHYYYLWRFGWVFYLLALLTIVLAFFTAIVAPCSRLASGISGVLVLNALFWFTLAASMMTAQFVQMRNEFHHNGLMAKLGSYAFGFTWAAWACMFIAAILLFTGVGQKSPRNDPRSPQTDGPHRGGFFRRGVGKRSTRGSFIDNESQRRVKDEYA
ncbi:putative SUR7 family protein FMP45 [Venustampulla echinocandica]|uniref:Putative SUR7 family protein FMP45 n=1 Tax=Venustampulla echinocandica TaxID=2656787 RepID=A0A370TKS1_9HELO|nr:putative SUR7 family protein FMP45 [Venustampulla echinocandica]RDL36121.1 putative SUR7 family protein FMP45 [Venustampulla echinocandica]